MNPMNVGIIGCGNISKIYLQNLTQKFPGVRVKACADLSAERAAARAAEFAGVQAVTVEAMLADPAIDVVVNLTIPLAHYDVSRAALDAGKHVYAEKPMALTPAEGADLLRRAGARGLRVGNAPDTFLGGALQTCRKLMDDGSVGIPVSCVAFMMCPGHESWHPDPEFYYQRGGGPLFDMGPYYLTALVSLLGPVRRVSACARITYPERTITSEPKRGTRIKVEVPTHVGGVLEFVNGAIGTLIMSFDVRGGTRLPCIEVHGSEGSLSVPDPNGFGGDVVLRRAGGKTWDPVALSHGYTANMRGLGVADLVGAVRRGRAHRASGELALHVLEIMESLHQSSAQGRHVELTSSCARPEPLPVGLREGEVDL